MQINNLAHVITEVFYVPDLKKNLFKYRSTTGERISYPNPTQPMQSISPRERTHHCNHYVTQSHVCSSSNYHTTRSGSTMFSYVFSKSRSPVALLLWTSESWWSQNALYMVKGLPQLKSSSLFCEDCLVGKQHRHSFPQESTWRALQILQLVHADIYGPISPISNSNKRYLLTFTDDFSRKT